MKLLIIPVILLISACSTGRPELQTQIDVLSLKVQNLNTEVQETKEIATVASINAGLANAEAHRAAELAQEVSDKIDKVFKKAMLK